MEVIGIFLLEFLSQELVAETNENTHSYVAFALDSIWAQMEVMCTYVCTPPATSPVTP